MGKVRFIIGSMTGNTWLGYKANTFYWKLEPNQKPEVGDYAIVENKDSYAMVEVVGIGETTEDKENLLMEGKGKICKNVKWIVPIEMLNGEKK